MESVATTLLATLANYLLNICRRPEGGRNKIAEDVEAIQRDLRRLKAILRDYDAKEDHDHQQPQMDIEQLRVASFKAADALEAYDNLHQLAQDDVHVMLDCLNCGIFKSIKNLKSQLEIASAIRHARSTVSIQFKAVDNQGGTSSIKELPYNSDSVWKSLKEDALLMEEDDLVGIETPRNKLIKWLLEEDSRRKVISVVGMGGLGKTTLVKKVFDDIKVKNQFKFRVWTTISESFNMDEFLKEIIRQIYNCETVPQEVEAMKTTSLKETIKSSFRSGSYVLILDDVWSRDAWIAIETSLPKGNGGRVVLTTRNARIAPPLGEIHLMGKLSHEESKTLFLRRTFRDGNCPTNLEQIVESIVRKCDGLPLAINALGAFLSKKTDKNEWELANSSLGFELMENKEIGFMNKILSLSYNELPDELKSCFLYLSIFPEDYSIEYKRLIRLWMTEKFVEVEEVAEEYFKLLQARNLIQATELSHEGRVKACRVHDILHKISISKSRHQKFAAIHKDSDAAWPENNCRRLSIHNNLQNVEQIRNNSHVRALFVFGLVDSPSKASLHLLIHNCRMVRVLDLQAAPLERFPLEITSLVHLRYLSLRHTKVKTIPSSIGNLKNLEILDLKHAHVSKLPASIIKLQKLRLLLVYLYDRRELYTDFKFKKGFKPPVNIGKLKSLQKLSHLEATQGRHMLTELANLIQLRRLGVIKLRAEDGTTLWSSIQNLSQLRALSITSVDEEEMIDLPDDQLSPQCLQRLQRLYLTGPLRKLPNWIAMVTSLVRCHLKWSRLYDSPLANLQHLPELVHLELLQAYVGKELHVQNGGFKKLKTLGIDKFDELETIEVENGAIPILEKFIIQRCNMLRNVPKGIDHLKSIKVLGLFDMPQELIMKLRLVDPSSENWKVAQIAQVYSTYWNQSWEDQSNLDKLEEKESFCMKNHCWK